jgi:hypothetical protein
VLFLFAQHAFAADPAPGPDAEVSAAEVEPPWTWLQAERPALADALASRNVSAATLDATAAVLDQADPRLVDLLLPAGTDAPLADATGEDPQVDLLSADAWLDGTVLHGFVAGPGVVEDGAALDVDLGNGPAADLELRFGRGWARALPLDGGIAPLADNVVPEIGDDRLDFAIDLGNRAPAAGSVRARLPTADGRTEDVGPAGLLGEPPDEALDVLLALVEAEPVTDADLAVSLAITFGTLRPLVADDVVTRVDADAVDWLRYGQGLDAWLADAGAEWRFDDLDAFGKLTWAWPAAQSVVYGAVPLAGVAGPLDADHYRFVVPDVATLERLRDLAPLSASLSGTAHAVDAAINGRLRYRTHDALMETLCRTRRMGKDVCAGWRADARSGRTLGVLGDTPVAQYEGVSASWQVGVLAREGAWVGDCATATALTIATLQALGIPAIGVGWSGEDFATPTHDIPLWYDGERFRGTQVGPAAKWANARAFVYVTLPGVHPINTFTLGREPGGWSRGGAVAGGWTTFGDLARTLREGLPAEVVGGWVDVEAAGGWPGW